MARIAAFSQSGAPLNSPVFTGIPEAPTAPPGTNNNQIATTAYADIAVANLVDSSPEALDTLKELAESLGNDPDFAGTVIAELGAKASLFDLLDHSNDTTGIHGIADTADLITTAELTDVIADTLASAEGSALTLDVQAIQQANSYTDTTVGSEIVAHNNVTQNVHGIADTANLLSSNTAITVSGLTNTGNTTLGNATTDTVTFTGRVNSSLLPSTTGNDLGGASNRWDVFAGDLNVSGNTTLGDASSDTVTFTGRVNSSLLPSANGFALGASSLRWNTYHQDAIVYGNTTLGSATTDTVTVNGRFASRLTPSTDNTRDLGLSTNRWKDLYLSGGVYLGGTTAGNLLDDYEEGTFTVGITANGVAQTTDVNECTYVKVGNQVSVAIRVRLSSMTANGGIRITDLPFPNKSANTYQMERVELQGSPSFAGYVFLTMLTGNSFVNMSVRNVSTQGISNLVSPTHVDSNTEFRTSFTYHTD